MVLSWEYIYKYFALICTIFSEVDKFFKQLKHVNHGILIVALFVGPHV